VSVNGGAPATATFMATAASRETGNAATFALADGQTLTVRIDGRPVQTISFLTAEFAAIGAATAAEVAAVINAKISGARATVTGAGMRVTITSDRRGTTSGVNVTGGTANGALAFATGNVAGGGNVADVDAVTVAEVKSVVQAAVAGVTVSNDAGRVSIASNSTGTGASIQVQAASTADDELGLDNAVHSGGNAGTLPADADGLRWASLASVNATASVQGDNGLAPTETELEGDGTVGRETGLFSLEAIDDVAIIAAPGETGQAIHNLLISHCERLRFRFAILDPSADRTLTEIRDDRARYDTTYGALYYPWVRVPHRTNPNPRAVELLPPSGFMAGIYARSDVERGVHKAPANEVVRGALGFEFCLTQGHQEVLNPEGINALRFFEGRGNRAWGARTLSSDPEWKYINVRRLFIFLEHSLDRGLKWVVFEPNNEKLWARVRLTITAFLTEVWRTGALLGSKPEEAFFVKCDRTTMTQSDLDNGRLVCLVGVAPTKPAEFVIIRIGQFTADAKLA
jgi:phage tail sheath protein FI